MGFKELDKTLVRDEGAEILISTLVTTEKSTNRKAVVVFEVTNTAPERPWVPAAAAIYAVKTGEQVPFVFWGWPASIDPGQTGRVALVTDLSSFDLANNGDEIAFEIYRDGGAHRATSYGMPSIYCLNSCLFSDLAGVNAKRRALECTRIMQPSFWLLPSRHAWVSVAQAPVFPCDRTEAPDHRSVRTKLLRP